MFKKNLIRKGMLLTAYKYELAEMAKIPQNIRDKMISEYDYTSRPVIFATGDNSLTATEAAVYTNACYTEAYKSIYKYVKLLSGIHKHPLYKRFLDPCGKKMSVAMVMFHILGKLSTKPQALKYSEVEELDDFVTNIGSAALNIRLTKIGISIIAINSAIIIGSIFSIMLR